LEKRSQHDFNYRIVGTAQSSVNENSLPEALAASLIIICHSALNRGTLMRFMIAGQKRILRIFENRLTPMVGLVTLPLLRLNLNCVFDNKTGDQSPLEKSF
jgi:hypothetical protein